MSQISPNPLPLSKERVIKAAISLADQSGLAALSMRKLAQQLHVEAMSLYHHVANKEELLDGMVDFIFGQIVVSDTEDWKTAMRQRAASSRAVLLQHPWATSLLDSRTNPGAATLQHHNSILGILRSAGFSVALAAHAFSLIDSYIYGFVIQEQQLPFRNQEELEHMAAAMLEHDAMDAYPHLKELITTHALQPDYAYSAEFAFGLELILEGLEQYFASASP